MKKPQLKIYGSCFNTPIGPLTVTANAQGIVSVEFRQSDFKDEFLLLIEAQKQFNEYFSGDRKEFSLPLDICGTAFQISVWKQLLKIPYGRTASYGEIAEAIGNPKACRAVGNANNKNPLAVVIPCHRVIGKNGSLTGYAGGLSIKKYLLELEAENEKVV